MLQGGGIKAQKSKLRSSARFNSSGETIELQGSIKKEETRNVSVNRAVGLQNYYVEGFSTYLVVVSALAQCKPAEEEQKKES